MFATSHDSAPGQAEAGTGASAAPRDAGDAPSESPSEESGDDESATPAITNDAVVLGLLLAILGLVFWTSRLTGPFWKTFYKIIPMLLLCYFLPSLLTVSGIVDPDKSQLYFMATRYLLPASLVLLTLSIDLREVLRLGPKALIMFLVGTVGVILGGPIAILIVKSFWPELVGGTGDQAVWRGLATVAGSWIGGGANQAAMKEIFLPSDALYSTMVAVDVLVAEFWMMFLLLGVGKAAAIDRFLRADASSVERLRDKMEEFSRQTARIPTATDLMVILALAFGFTAVSHACADWLAPWFEAHYPQLNRLSLNSQFFWLIVLATTFGVGLSFTPRDAWKARRVEDRHRVHLHPGGYDWTENGYPGRGGATGTVSRRRDLDGVSCRAVVPGRLSDPSSLLLSGRRQQGQHRGSSQRRRSSRRRSIRRWPRLACSWPSWATRWAPTAPGSART